MENDDGEKRNFTDADVRAMVAEARKEFARQFNEDIGRGVYSAVKAVVVAAFILLAAWGAKIDLGTLPDIK